MSARALRLLPVYLARRWVLTLVVSILTVFTASYFYFTAVHALESFDTESCTPLTLDSPPGECVASLQALLNDDLPYPYPAIAVDGNFGNHTEEAVIEFQSVHHLAVDGIVGGKTADAINEFSPRPSILSYASGFVDTRLALQAKLCVAACTIAVTIMCLLLRAARSGDSSLIRIRALAGSFTGLTAANSAAAGTLMTEAHGWVAKFLCIILIALAAVLLELLREILPPISALSRFADHRVQENQSQTEAWYGR
jgi:Putative peptidoglycan binding domain